MPSLVTLLADYPTLVPPLYSTPRRPTRPTHGPQLVKVAGLLGWSMFEWQRFAADVSMEFDPYTRVPHYRTVGVSVARQNGKTTLVLARIAAQLIQPRQTVVYTAQDRSMARFKWAEHVEMLMGTPFAALVRRIERVNGREALVMNNGSRYLIVTPGDKKAGRSLSVDLAVIDEAFSQRDMGLIGAIEPTMATRPRAQLWILSNAGTAESVLWRHYTDLGRSVVDLERSPLAWLEWAPPDGADRLDPVTWRCANPTLGLPHGILMSHLEGTVLGDPVTFDREYLNLWSDLNMLTGIDPVTWAACGPRDDYVQALASPVVLGVDVTPDRDRGSLVAVSGPDGRTPIEVIEHTADLDRLVRRTVEVARRWDSVVVIDRGSPAANAIPAIEKAGVAVRSLSIVDFTRACVDFHDAAVHARLSHAGDYRLTDAVAAATKRKVVDTWAWQRRGGTDLTCLIGATLGRWGIVSTAAELEPSVW